MLLSVVLTTRYFLCRPNCTFWRLKFDAFLDRQAYTQSSSHQQANSNRDALAKALYCRTVAAVVRRVNSYKRPTSMLSSPYGSYESLRASSPGSGTGSLGRSPVNSTNGLLMTPGTGTLKIFLQ